MIHIHHSDGVCCSPIRFLVCCADEEGAEEEQADRRPALPGRLNWHRRGRCAVRAVLLTYMMRAMEAGVLLLESNGKRRASGLIFMQVRFSREWNRRTGPYN
jgi:hypothetical protein